MMKIKEIYAAILEGVVLGVLCGIGVFAAILIWPWKYLSGEFRSSDSFVEFFDNWSWHRFFYSWLDWTWSWDTADAFFGAFTIGFTVGFFYGMFKILLRKYNQSRFW